ncbi:hypothetical protein BDV96DRAFT_589304 [Lophiotrema nucula]|uniref:Uncharacterized protein n=1 Tax=Lophiotrema nucula TaxID=690887 RepID=A0A6A5YK10_9PLEO|nr:hypothetical protein BDV96DRAFT_589304 [Lophiotrema nucula]
MPLNIMTTLARSRRITTYAGGLYIKTFCAILALTKQIGQVLVWHLVFNDDGEHISYSDRRVLATDALKSDNISIATLESSRHILGWCENIESKVGSPRANYNIIWSGLSKPSSKCAFEKVSISGGYFVSASMSAALGKKDKPVYIKSRDDYISRLKWIEKKYVVLYDLEDRRAWLADGVSALLHLVRASLEHDAQDDFKGLFRYKPELLQEADPCKSGKAAAISVLTNAQNQELEIYQKPDGNSAETTIKQTGEIEEVTKRTKTFFRFKDRVDHTYNLLEQIIAYQSQLDSEDGVGFRIKLTPRRQIEGFDFMDIASDEDPIWPRVTSLKATGTGWVDFTRALHAITLFGIGFGSLMKPHDEVTACLYWAEVPKGLDYLAVCVSDLKEVLKKKGNMRERPWRLVDQIYWHVPDLLFDKCDCSSRSPKAGCDRVQVLLPAKVLKTWARKLTSPSKLEDSGAVIFGHSRKFPLRWTDRGECPALGEPSNEDDVADAFEDSGLGESIEGSRLSGSSGGHGSSDSSKEKQKKGLFDGFSVWKRLQSKSPADQASG